MFRCSMFDVPPQISAGHHLDDVTPSTRRLLFLPMSDVRCSADLPAISTTHVIHAALFPSMLDVPMVDVPPQISRGPPSRRRHAIHAVPPLPFDVPSALWLPATWQTAKMDGPRILIPPTATANSRLPTLSKESCHDNSLRIVHFSRWHIGCVRLSRAGSGARRGAGERNCRLDDRRNVQPDAHDCRSRFLGTGRQVT